MKARDPKIGSVLDNVMMLRDEWTSYAEAFEILNKESEVAKMTRKCIGDLSDIEYDLKELWNNSEI